MGVFRFKRFEVVNERSAMKVNTDGVLLGASMTISPDDRNVLDIGTGTGTIALMAAQRLAEQVFNRSGNDAVKIVRENNIWIDAIDVDEPSATEAGNNFRNSPWSGILHAHHQSLDSFASALFSASGRPKKYDLIFSNPPYFEDSLVAPDERKSTARHTSEGLSYRDIFEFSKNALSDTGRVSLVLPADQEAAVCRYARMCGLYLFNILRVRTVPRKSPSRIIVEFSRVRCNEIKDLVLTIQDDGKYTQEYLSLTKDFYLFA